MRANHLPQRESLRIIPDDPAATASSGLAAYPTSAPAVVVDIAQLMRTIWAASITVIALGIVDQILRRTHGAEAFLSAVPYFNLDVERTVPTWYSSMLMAASAVLMLVIADALQNADSRVTRRWFALALVFFYLSIDESVAIHERFNFLQKSFGFTGVLYFSWVVVAAPLLLAGALYFLPLVTRLDRSIRSRVVLAGALYVYGAFGMELLGGYIKSTHLGKVAYQIEVITEESLEIIGLTLFLSALLLQLGSLSPPATVRFVASQERR